MDYRLLGGSGLKVSALSLGTGTFAGANASDRAWAKTDIDEATRMVDLCLDAGINLFDSADVYSKGIAESIFGETIAGRRDKVIISTKATFRMSDEPNDVGSSRHHIIRSVEASLRRLQTDYIDIYTLHGFDAQTPVEEALRTLDTLVQSGKVRYTACSNFSGWHLMKSLAVSDRYGWTRYSAHQAFYSLIGREYEWELMPLALDQKVGTLVWSPLAGGRLGGRFRRGQPAPTDSRIVRGSGEGPAKFDENFYKLIDVIEEIGKEVGKSIPQIAINWLLQRPTIASVIIGARNEQQLNDNLGAADWNLTAEQVARLDAASEPERIYPYWHQYNFQERNPLPTPSYL